jgi:DNA ligase-associated metallophosphoesterase
MLIVADIHFGKAAAFRAEGVPVPRGTTTQNVDALDQLIALHGVQHILFLGDFLHARASHADATLTVLRNWRKRNPALILTLVRGNHDTHAGDPPADLNINLADEPHELGGFSFCHHPHVQARGYVLAGHLHPVYRLTVAGDSVRLPCFVFGDSVGMMPSFGAFTGGFAISPQQGERVIVAADDAVFEVPDGTTVFTQIA